MARSRGDCLRIAPQGRRESLHERRPAILGAVCEWMLIVLIIAPRTNCLATVRYAVIMVPARIVGPCRVAFERSLRLSVSGGIGRPEVLLDKQEDRSGQAQQTPARLRPTQGRFDERQEDRRRTGHRCPRGPHGAQEARCAQGRGGRARRGHLTKRLIREEGLLVGGSAGTNVVAAVRVASRRGLKGPVVTVLPDLWDRYRAKPWMQGWGP